MVINVTMEWLGGNEKRSLWALGYAQSLYVPILHWVAVQIKAMESWCMLFLHDPEEILFPPLTNDDNFNAETREEGQIVNSCGQVTSVMIYRTVK